MEANQTVFIDKHRKTDNKIETLREYASKMLYQLLIDYP